MLFKFSSGFLSNFQRNGISSRSFNGLINMLRNDSISNFIGSPSMRQYTRNVSSSRVRHMHSHGHSYSHGHGIGTHSVRRYANAFFTRENIPPIALVIGCVALCFQIGVLYPWHEILSEEFNELQALSKDVHLLAADLGVKMDTVVKLEEEVKAKERKVLDHEVEILAAQQEILKISFDLNAKMDRVLALEEEVKAKERKVLDREEEILVTEKMILAKVEILLQQASFSNHSITHNPENLMIKLLDKQ